MTKGTLLFVLYWHQKTDLLHWLVALFICCMPSKSTLFQSYMWRLIPLSSGHHFFFGYTKWWMKEINSWETPGRGSDQVFDRHLALNLIMFVERVTPRSDPVWRYMSVDLIISLQRHLASKLNMSLERHLVADLNMSIERPLVGLWSCL